MSSMSYGNAAQAIAAMFGVKMPPDPTIAAPTSTPAPIDYAAQQAEKDNAAKQRTVGVKAAGRQSTILTDGGGLGDYSLAPTGQRTLLGG